MQILLYTIQLAIDLKHLNLIDYLSLTNQLQDLLLTFVHWGFCICVIHYNRYTFIYLEG